MKLIDRTGLRFGRLVVLRKDAAPRMWACRCDCGKEVLVNGSNLTKGATKSCGCLLLEWSSQLGSNPEFVKTRSEKLVRHGHKRRSGMSVEYGTWLAIKRRCQDPKCKDYPSWGGRGITVCQRWSDSFEVFLEDMGERPADKTSIDRINGSKGYEPGNCRWADAMEQGENKATNLPVSFGGVEYPSLREACRTLGLRYTTVFARTRSGYTIEQALSFGSGRPPNTRPRESYLRKPHANWPPARS